MATAAPAAAIGRDDLGRLAEGLPADLVHLDDGLALAGVWRAGQAVGTRAHSRCERIRPVDSGRLAAGTDSLAMTASWGNPHMHNACTTHAQPVC